MDTEPVGGVMTHDLAVVALTVDADDDPFALAATCGECGWWDEECVSPRRAVAPAFVRLWARWWAAHREVS